MDKKKQLFNEKELYRFGQLCFEFGMAEGAKKMAIFIEKEKGRYKNNGRRNIKRAGKKTFSSDRRAKTR